MALPLHFIPVRFAEREPDFKVVVAHCVARGIGGLKFPSKTDKPAAAPIHKKQTREWRMPR